MFGICAGALTVLIRLKGGYPEGVMFAILLMNCFAPLLDRGMRSRGLRQGRGQGGEEMKEMLKITLSLVAIFIAAGLIMGVTYKYTSPVRFMAEKKEKEEALKEMAPDATDPINACGELEQQPR